LALEIPSFEKQYFAVDLAKVPNYLYFNSDHGVLLTRNSRAYSKIDD
jgi:hypothetical protein